MNDYSNYIKDAVWVPQAGSQLFFLSCPIEEVLFDGTRGNGKTDSLIMDFYQDCNKGFKSDWRGILFRNTYKQLSDIVLKTKKWFSLIEPRAKFNASAMSWTFPEGEVLFLSYMRNIQDYAVYHGKEFSWIGWEELTNWKDIECYESMNKSCLRASGPGIIPRTRSTTNSYGVGHAWVKKYFVDPAPAGKIITDKDENRRVRIHGNVQENKILLKNDPKYINKLKSITDPNKRKAWYEGSWDIVAGGAFSDLWAPEIHVVEPFDIPTYWKVERSFDWGSSAPYAVPFFAESDGTPVKINNKIRSFPKGTLFLIDEVYGWTGKENKGVNHTPKKIAESILIKEKILKKKFNIGRIRPGPADNQIFSSSPGERTIADKMAELKIDGCNITWEWANKKPHSRVQGVELMRDLLESSNDLITKGSMEYPGFFVFNNCEQFLRTVPNIPRNPSNMDDVDSDSEDHMWDAVRYEILSKSYSCFYGSIQG